MQVFINEKSLHNQFTAYNIQAAVDTFLSAIAVFNEWEVKRDTYASSTIFYAEAVPGVFLTEIVKANKELNDRFLANLKNWGYWEDTIEHDTTCAYTYSAKDYVTSSVAEITQRKINKRSLNTFLLNFTNSLFGTAANIEVIKAPATKAKVDCVYDKDTVTKWLIAKKVIDPAKPYAKTSRVPPQDFQTVLITSGQFTLTHYRNQGRKVYKRAGYDELWVIDNFHVGTDAHIEVFSSVTGNHIGISEIGKIAIDTQYQDSDKSIIL